MEPWAMVKGTPMALQHMGRLQGPRGAGGAGRGADAEFVELKKNSLTLHKFKADIAGVRQAVLPVTVYPGVGHSSPGGAFSSLSRRDLTKVFSFSRFRPANSQAGPSR